MQFKVISLIFAAATMVAGSPVAPPAYAVCSSTQVAVCCEADGYTPEYDTCEPAGTPKKVKAFEKKCAKLYGGYEAFCCEYSYGEYSNCVKE